MGILLETPHDKLPMENIVANKRKRKPTSHEVSNKIPFVLGFFMGVWSNVYACGISHHLLLLMSTFSFLISPSVVINNLFCLLAHKLSKHFLQTKLLSSRSSYMEVFLLLYSCIWWVFSRSHCFSKSLEPWYIFSDMKLDQWGIILSYLTNYLILHGLIKQCFLAFMYLRFRPNCLANSYMLFYSSLICIVIFLF
jgi:hypothetical protein